MATHSFHRRFADALCEPGSSGLALQRVNSARRSERRFDVYRNNRVMSLIESLRATYPAIARLVGDDFFKACARAYIDDTPPVQPVMAEYGSGFGAFIASLPTTASLPFLRNVAELEWLRLQAFHSADAPVLATTALADVAPDALMDARLVCHDATRAMSSEWPVLTIWQNCSRPPEEEAPVNMREGQAVVLTRPSLTVHCNLLEPAEQVFLDGLIRRESIGVAANAALENTPGFDVGHCLIRLLESGAFSALELN